MSFSANPLALSVPEPAFESWLRDTGYLEVLDQKTSDLSAAGTSVDSAAATTSFPTAGIDTGVFISLFSKIWTLISLLTINPVSKLTAGDFSGDTAAWTSGFIGFYDSYSFPSSPDQARMRVHENVKRHAKNYASLFVLFFACSLYQMPLALIGLLSSLALWDVFRCYGNRWGLDEYPVLKQTLFAIMQVGTLVLLMYFNVQMALLCAVGVTYAVTILHASFRKLSPAKPPTRGRSK
ncbi:PRA1 family protein H [Heracleum sosnowskyi]|uniref:PRA1 family protein n=1 Tax=Heracleum sosnowskyi TaxID=360622 RepID=A0AAD8NEP2_9APIA|nr:PRA1 family protein H [Heracleum sosnowskyi]